MADQSLLTVRQVADELQVSPQTVRNWIEHGTLAAARIGRAFRVRRGDLDALLSQRPEHGNSNRDLWHPNTNTLPRRHDRSRSIWDEASTPAASLADGPRR